MNKINLMGFCLFLKIHTINSNNVFDMLVNRAHYSCPKHVFIIVLSDCNQQLSNSATVLILVMSYFI